MVALGASSTHHHNRNHQRSKSDQQQQQQNQQQLKEQSFQTSDDKATITTTDTYPSDDDTYAYHPATSDLPLLKDSTHEHIERIFTALRGREGDYITRERLEEFLVDSQGGLVRPLEKETYTLGDFVYIWLHDYSAALRPLVGKRDLSKPITNYFISSSHNTYIGHGNQLNGEVSADAYREVLEGDCRCVEIDVWNGEGWLEAAGRSRSPSRSKSPYRFARKDGGDAAATTTTLATTTTNTTITTTTTATTATTHNQHKRYPSNLSTLSTDSIPTDPQSLVDIMDQKWQELTQAMRETNGRYTFSPRPGTSLGSSSGPGPKRVSNASASMSQLHLTLPEANHSSISLDRELLDPNMLGDQQQQQQQQQYRIRHVKSAESLSSRVRGISSRSRSRSREPRGMRGGSSSRRRRVEPEVTHAHTVQGLGDVGLAKRIPLREVCRVIRESAFRTNKLPVIVSLEVHATGEQQDMMVEIMKEEWGDHLLDVRLDGCDPDERQPRLEELKEKILVKVKRAAGSTSPSKGGSQLTVPTINDDDASGSEDERAGGDSPLSQVRKRSKTKIGEALGRLAIYTHSEHYKDFSSPGAQTPSHIFSMDEYKILKLHQTKHREMFIHNRKYFMRAYPHSTRVNSTNLDPSLYWRKGVQMVALNWQRAHVDEAMMLNSAMFESEQGWVLKPQGYLTGDPTASQSEAGNHQTLQRLRITILAGQHLPLPRDSDSDSSSMSSMSTSDSTGFKPFVKCELHVETPEERNEKKAIKSGLAQDGQYKLVTKSSETENPDWGVGQVLEFPQIKSIVEELSFVR